MTTDAILNVMSNSQTIINNVKNQFYNVILEPSRVSNPLLEQPKDCYHVINERTNEYLSKGTMGKNFVPMQQSEFLENILTTIQEYGANLDINTLKFNSFCGGSKIEFTIEMEPIEFTNARKLKDVTKRMLTFSTSYDGSKANVISLYTFRLVCLNGMTAKGLEGTLKGRNTNGGKTKILSYCKELAELINGAEDFKNKMIELDKRKVTQDEIEDYKLKVFGYNRATLMAQEKTPTAKLKTLELIDEAFKIEFENGGMTAFSLLQGVTHYTNHFSISDGTTEEYIKFNQGFRTNEKAQKLAFEMI